MKKTLLTLTLILTLILTLLVIPVGAADGEEVTVEYYGRAALAECENSTALLYAYDAITAGIAACESEISVHNGTDNLSTDELTAVIDAYIRDRADHFWMGKEYSVSTTQDAEGNTVTVKAIFPTYIFEGDTLAAAKAEVEEQVTAILAGIDDSMSDYDKLLYLHDTLAGRIEYVDGEQAHNLYGALVLGECVCEGYAESLQYLLHRMGVEAFLAIGSSLNPASGTKEGHEWSYVKLDGEWYHVDLTWDDQGEALYHAYFAVTDDVILVDHEIEPTAYALPSCTSTAINYFDKEGLVVAAPYSTDEIAAHLTAGGGKASILVDDFASFYEWFSNNANITEIASKCGVTGTFSYGASHLGNEAKIYIDNCNHAGLTYAPSSEAYCGVKGNIEHYYCPDCGRYFSDELATDMLTRTEVELPALDHSYTVKTGTAEFLKDEGDCQVKETYWYACEHCGKSAAEDTLAQDKFYEGELGDHVIDTQKWVGSDGEHGHPCTVPGCEHIADKAPCAGGTATCIALAKCDTCGAEHGELGEHSYDTENYGYKKPDGHAHTCTVCRAPDTVTPHASAEGAVATEETPVLCQDCGYIMTPALNHGENHVPREEWDSDESGHWHDCTGCEEQQLEKAEHVDEDENLFCDVCAHPVEPKSEPELEPIVDPLPSIIDKYLTKDIVIWGAVIAGAVILLSLIIRIVIFARRRRSRW